FPAFFSYLQVVSPCTSDVWFILFLHCIYFLHCSCLQFTKPTAKRKHWSNEQPKSSTKSRIEITQERAESGGENENLESQGMTKEAHELLVKPNPSSLYWKELAEEQRKPLFHALQENERLHKEIKLKDEEILQLKEQNQEIIELTDHVKYMADLIEVSNLSCMLHGDEDVPRCRTEYINSDSSWGQGGEGEGKGGGRWHGQRGGF
uniref:Geminin DNA replication inhibitor n=1 Tax=Callorhinchus milii TaxID=7868 RepID=A0A4W3JE22_CALMI